MKGYRYAVMRFMPDAERQETVNVGIVVAPEGARPIVKVIGQGDGRRLSALGYHGSTAFLGELQKDILRWGWGASSSLERAQKEWGGTVRFSELRGALHTDPGALCDELYARYVGGPNATPFAGVRRDRNMAKRVARDGLRRRLPPEVVSTNQAVPGKVESHRFDLGIRNGHLLHVVAALSFDIQTTRLLTAEVDACAWAISDVREVDRTIPISVVTIGGTQRKLLDRTRSICNSLGAKMVPEAGVPAWAKDVERELGPALKQASVLTP